MLYETFDSVRGLLKAIPQLKTIQWYNAQYDGVIYVSPVAFVEFPERIPLDQVAGSVSRADFALRIHIVSACTAAQDGSISDNVIQDHEAIASQVQDILQGKQIRMVGSTSTSLVPSGWQHYHKYKGWMVTFVDFKGMAILD
ncbi:hypothetical protein [Parabacteroides sp. AF17-28]|jgi:hypothetical protein|uniref:hypothetical protein n=1 Tax=Parabacteroides sp. AF17-28 TaxID=2292241 RepID=UPI000F001762|nr:hypothetical protein [Parabacteroides sp. AF17-28]RHR56608.1 hypothetical protein DWW90_12535 [Parabacteroides sp. AF17-28]